MPNWGLWGFSSAPEQLLTILRDAATRKFLTLAKHVKPLARFSATEEQLTAEAKRKQAALHYARTEMRAIQEELVTHLQKAPSHRASVMRTEYLSDRASELRQSACCHSRMMWQETATARPSVA